MNPLVSSPKTLSVLPVSNRSPFHYRMVVIALASHVDIAMPAKENVENGEISPPHTNVSKTDNSFSVIQADFPLFIGHKYVTYPYPNQSLARRMRPL